MSGSSRKSFQAPPGTRDVYPEEMLRRRYLVETWRGVSVRHGFEEIEGPAFESSELYAVKSGEGILGELFQAFSGKSPEEVEAVRAEGRAPWALRPEFTPTLARMYAARAKQLPKPVRWFCVPNFFRAERPQRGRLREFLQWNVDVVGDDDASADNAVFSTIVDSLRAFGFSPRDLRVNVGHRGNIEHMLRRHGVPDDDHVRWLQLFDKIEKLDHEAFIRAGVDLGGSEESVREMRDVLSSEPLFGDMYPEQIISGDAMSDRGEQLQVFVASLMEKGEADWFKLNRAIVRGLAYYTGTVFELIAEGERAVAGGGRYDGLIELMGGPATPAVGFAMGDVVVSLLLEEKGLMPGGLELMEAVERAAASYSLRPEAFVVGNGDEDCEGMVVPLVAALRRGVEDGAWLDKDERKPWDRDRYAIEPLHARVTSKTTRNMKKLKGEASKVFARFFVEVHGADKVEVWDLDRGEAVTPGVIGERGAASFSVDPASGAYVGRGLAAVCGRAGRVGTCGGGGGAA